MLRDLKLKAVYRSESDNILEDFYLPVLSSSVKYDRAVGFFSASMLSYAAQGISAFVNNDGRMRLIFGGEISPEDASAIQQGYEIRNMEENLGMRLVKEIESIDDGLFQRRLEALSWLVASGRLEIKVALKARGMYHEKIGVLTDAENDSVIFQGSANETSYALLPDFNFESINVFQSWRKEFEEHYLPYMRGFESLWKNESKKTIVIPFPEAAKEKLIRIAKNSDTPLIPKQELELYLAKIGKNEDGVGTIAMQPRIPEFLGGSPFKIGEHQRDALNQWKSNDCNGIVALATGAGKTITAIYGIVKLYEAFKRLFVVIAVPYQNLADQWCTVLKEFKIIPIPCYESAQIWMARLSEAVTLFQSNATDFCCAVVVDRTLGSDTFQGMLGQIPGSYLLWIGDECHHHSSEGMVRCLPAQAKHRLGLSATPLHYMNERANDRLLRYYGKVVKEYTLENALQDKVLTPYRYYVVPVDLTAEETEEYLELSGKIAQIMAGSVEGRMPENIVLENLLLRRARLLGSAHYKIEALRDILSEQKRSTLNLFYCGDGQTEDDVTGEENRQIEVVSQVLGDLGWRTSRFTSRESREDRESLLDHFRLGLIDGLVAIRCLDEGIDVPACRTAYLLASSRNPRQQIQRRGRILRKANGKNFATIYDFLVKIPSTMAQGDGPDRNLVKQELMRAAEFANLAMNRAEVVGSLMDLLKQYDLAHVLT
ncbi:MAG: DEAD/DEAH box helicase family protein [Kiritimatiellae bacterium]|nr:DEAD/DEAH box helicase family protein [Kiritimatiellia bacterium]MDD5519518.1 DEAD/DEAH box helicase family protein [Kiritimatiellia bacterium]